MLRKANPDMEETAIPVELVTCSDSRFLGVFGEKNRKCSESQFDVGRYPVTSTLKRFRTSAHLYTILISKQPYLRPFNTNKDRIKAI